MSVDIYYDGQCPFCSNYVTMLRLREVAGPVRLHDLRAAPEARARFEARGLDPDKGMLVETGGQLYHGADAMTALSLMSGGSGVLNRITAALFRQKPAARLLYPLLRAGRNATLFALGRAPLRTAAADEAALFELFSRFLGLLTILHVINYLFRYSHFEVQATTLPLLICGFGLIFAPWSRRIFVVLVGLFLYDFWAGAPVTSNSTFLRGMLMVTIGLAGVWHLLRGASWEEFLRSVRPVARMLLMIMYTFGIFHKINTGFLDPEVSCAVTLWRLMPPPLSWLDVPLVHYLTIYGTFVAEGAIMVMLVVARWRHWGIGLGIAFHGMLAFSAYAVYPAFSTLSVLLHLLFLSPAAALKITQSPGYAAYHGVMRRPAGILAMLVLLGVYAWFVQRGTYGMAGPLWALMVAWPLAAIFLGGRGAEPGETSARFFWSPTQGLNLVTLFFFLNCIGPYFGLKTAQTMNMFANLHLEGGVSNHLVFRNPPAPFGYLDKVVTVTEAEAPLAWMARDATRGFVYYHFLTILERAPKARVSYAINGVPQGSALAADLLARDGDILHPAWVRKFFHFRNVNLTEGPVCR